MMHLKPNCKFCNKPYIGEGDGNGACLYCSRSKPRKELKCQCGKNAVVIIQTMVGVTPSYFVELPLCEDCLKLELKSSK